MEFILSVQSAIDNVLRYPLIIMLLGTGVFLTVRLGFIQFRQLVHGVKVTMGKYDDPNDPGDVSHFQALTTALSATVGIGNIAGVAIAIHWGGPGAIFWMWITAILGMTTKFVEVTLAMRFRAVETGETNRMVGTVSGGPMYYIEHGLGPKWKPLAVFVAFSLMLTAFLTGNAIQANTIADLMQTEFSMPVWLTGAITAAVVGMVILGGIRRIGAVTGVLAPLMACIYVVGGLIILVVFSDQVFPSIKLIFTEAFNPTAGIAGTGVGIFIQTMLWGVRRGLFSNEAGQGSAPIAHAAAKTEEPVREGVVALLGPFIDTIIICSITALVILSSGAWNDTRPTELTFDDGDWSYVVHSPAGYIEAEASSLPANIRIQSGKPVSTGDAGVFYAWHEVKVQEFFVDEDHATPFSGQIMLKDHNAVADDGTVYASLYGPAVESGAPLTAMGFSRGLGSVGKFIVILSVFLFGISTAISWSYYGDRCAHYLFGRKAILPYKMVFVVMHFLGAVTALNTIWGLGDTALSLVTIPNVFALLLLSGVVKTMTDDYFERKPGKSRH